MLSDRQVLNQALDVVNNNFMALLSTVDREGIPHARWMGSSTAAEGLHRLYTLSGKRTRKVEQIRDNPEVCWVFTSEGHGDVVTLYGRARIMTSPSVAQAVWDRLLEHAHRYVMGALSENEEAEYVTIETIIHRIELLCPRRKMYVPRSVTLEPT